MLREGKSSVKGHGKGDKGYSVKGREFKCTVSMEGSKGKGSQV